MRGCCVVQHLETPRCGREAPNRPCWITHARLRCVVDPRLALRGGRGTQQVCRRLRKASLAARLCHSTPQQVHERRAERARSDSDREVRTPRIPAPRGRLRRARRLPPAPLAQCPRPAPTNGSRAASTHAGVARGRKAGSTRGGEGHSAATWLAGCVFADQSCNTCPQGRSSDHRAPKRVQAEAAPPPPPTAQARGLRASRAPSPARACGRRSARGARACGQHGPPGRGRASRARARAAAGRRGVRRVERGDQRAPKRVQVEAPRDAAVFGAPRLVPDVALRHAAEGAGGLRRGARGGRGRGPGRRRHACGARGRRGHGRGALTTVWPGESGESVSMSTRISSTCGGTRGAFQATFAGLNGAKSTLLSTVL